MGERLVFVERLQLGANERHHVRRPPGRAHHDAHERLGPLRFRDDHLRLRSPIERLGVDVADHSDDLPDVLVLAETCQTAPDGVPAVQVVAHERLVHQDDLRRAVIVGRAQLAPLQQRDAERLHITGRRPDDLGVVLLAGRTRRFALDLEAEARVELRIEGDAGQDRSALDARKRRDSLQQLLLEGADRLILAVLVLGEHRLRHEDVAGIREAGAYREQAVQRADHEAGADDQDEGERDLRHDESGACASTRRGTRCAVLERFHQIRPAGVERGDDSRDDARGDGDTQREREHRAIQSHLVEARDGPRSEGDERVETPGGEEHPERAADKRQQQRLGEELPQDPSAPAAESGADGKLALPRCSARQQHARDVRTGDEEHQHHRP